MSNGLWSIVKWSLAKCQMMFGQSPNEVCSNVKWSLAKWQMRFAQMSNGLWPNGKWSLAKCQMRFGYVILIYLSIDKLNDYKTHVYICTCHNETWRQKDQGRNSIRM